MHENGEQITCEANNPVLEFYNEQPQRASVALSITCENPLEIVLILNIHQKLQLKKDIFLVYLEKSYFYFKFLPWSKCLPRTPLSWNITRP